MSDFDRCPKCESFDFLDRHQCPPRWFVWCADEYDEDEPGQIVYARDAEEAAERWAAESDAYGDYDIVSGSDATVRVTAASGGEPIWLVVSGETVPEYTARRQRKSSGGAG